MISGHGFSTITNSWTVQASGSQFDPDLVRIFKSIPKEKIEECAPEALKIGLED